MSDPDQGQLRQRLDSLAPLFRDVGARTLEIYARGGILDAVADDSIPVSDALFTRKHGRYVYHPHGPVYVYVTRSGELQLAGQPAGGSLAQAISTYAHLARPDELGGGAVVEGATEWFPPPRFVLDPHTSRLYIAAAPATALERPQTEFLPFEDYVDQRAQLFVAAFHMAQ